MNKATLYVVGGLGALGLVFMWRKKSSGLKTPLGIPAPNNQPGAKPRVDNQQQPWYTGPLNFLSNKSQEYAKNPVQAQSDMQSVIHSASDIWGTISGAFGSSSTANTDALPDPALTSAPDDPSVTTTMPSTSADQSNMIGLQMGDYADNSMSDPSTIMSDPSASGSFIDNSNSDYGLGSDNLITA